jgi:hypothetical protein
MLQGKFETTAAHKNTKQETLTNDGISNILINLEESIGSPAHTGLISPSVCSFVCPSGIQKTVHFECRN